MSGQLTLIVSTMSKIFSRSWVIPSNPNGRTPSKTLSVPCTPSKTLLAISWTSYKILRLASRLSMRNHMLTFRVDSTFLDLCFDSSDECPLESNRSLEAESEISEGLPCCCENWLSSFSMTVSTCFNEGIKVKGELVSKCHWEHRRFQMVFGHTLGHRRCLMPLWCQLDWLPPAIAPRRFLG